MSKTKHFSYLFLFNRAKSLIIVFTNSKNTELKQETTNTFGINKILHR